MLSRVPSQPHNGYADYQDYAHRPGMITSNPQVPSLQRNKPQAFDDNLHPGRKRSQSEVDGIDDNDSANVRRRISRACDQCNQLRTKCDGKQPCAHCIDNALSCEYARVHKKRGRAPKKDLDQSDDGGFPNNNNNNNNNTTQAARPNRPSLSSRKYSGQSFAGHDGMIEAGVPSGNTPTSATFDSTQHNQFYGGFDHATNMPMNTNGQMPNMNQSMVTQLNQPQAMEFSVDSGTFAPSGLDGMHAAGGTQGFGFPLGDDYSVAFMGKAPMVESPDWLALTSPMYLTEPLANQPRPPDELRYPVLRPLLPHIESIMPQALACDLLEQYFSSSTSSYLRPANPYIIGHIFRKKAMLHPTDPRPCTPALLASMLWTAAQTSDAGFLTTQLDARGRICQRLLELTISMLKPLIHSNPITMNPTPTYHHIPASDAGLGGLVVPTDHSTIQGSDRAQVDNLATYIHLATVVSASERKAASLRWWNAAWSLAREIRLGRELPPNPPEQDNEESKTNANEPKNKNDVRKGSVDDVRSQKYFISEEEREERRRTWWLLYMQDRHLALCYNRPMFFLNKECEGLLQPFDDEVWQAGRFDNNASSNVNRRRGLNIECTSHSIFGYFLPLMVILGEILDLNHARNRPHFGPRASRTRRWDDFTDDITQTLETYGQSLRDFQASNGYPPDNHNEVMTPSVVSTATNESVSAQELTLQTKTTVAYGNHIMHVLHILLTGKWDPIALLDDNDLWISSQSFVTATGHAVAAAEAVGEIIEYDPDLSFMPFFFGIYLLQGSFLLLLFADKLQGDVSPDVVKACETIVRAHEACVATLDTQYQVRYVSPCRRTNILTN